MPLYTTKAMLKALNQVHKPKGFLLNTFVKGGTENHTEKTVEIDIVRHGKKMAPFVSPIRQGIVLEKEGYETRTHTIPYIKIKQPTEAQEVFQRLPGNTIYDQNMSPAKFVAQSMKKTLKEIDEMIWRTEEKMASDAMQTGKVIVSGKGLEYQIDFGMKSTHLPDISLVAGDRWDAETADIKGQLEDLGDLVSDDSGLNASDVILGHSVARAMLKNPSYIGSLDRRRIDRGEIKISRLPDGVKYLGFDRDSGLDMWTYNEKYFDEDSQTYKYLIDPKKIVVGSRNAMFKRHYGLIQNVQSAYVGPRFPTNWIENDPSVHYMMIESAPLVALHQPDAFVCAKVLA
jgi:hypothetical protein